jgi:hypothetical protein
LLIHVSDLHWETLFRPSPLSESRELSHRDCAQLHETRYRPACPYEVYQLTQRFQSARNRPRPVYLDCCDRDAYRECSPLFS